MAGLNQLNFEEQDNATFNMARCDRKERLDTCVRDRERKKERWQKEINTKRVRRTKGRMNGGRRQEKIPLQMWSILAHYRSRQTTIAPTRFQTAVYTLVLMREVSF